MKLYFRTYAAPCGKLLLGATDSSLMLADWITENKFSDWQFQLPFTRNLPHLLRRCPEAECVMANSPALAIAESQLNEYFEGKRHDFSIPLQFAGTPFQLKVWNELLLIPYASTLSYRELAVRVGSPKAIRGVAAAVGANRMSVVLPCHRVIGADGSLTGYAGGLDAKKFLLTHEFNAVERLKR